MTTTQRSPEEPIETVAELLDVIERRPSLAVEADLTVAVDGTAVAITGYDDVVAADVASFGPVVALWRRYGDRTMDGAAALASVGLTASCASVASRWPAWVPTPIRARSRAGSDSGRSNSFRKGRCWRRSLDGADEPEQFLPVVTARSREHVGGRVDVEHVRDRPVGVRARRDPEPVAVPDRDPPLDRERRIGVCELQRRRVPPDASAVAAVDADAFGPVAVDGGEPRSRSSSAKADWASERTVGRIIAGPIPGDSGGWKVSRVAKKKRHWRSIPVAVSAAARVRTSSYSFVAPSTRAVGSLNTVSTLSSISSQPPSARSSSETVGKAASDTLPPQWSSSRHLCSHSVQVKKRVSDSSAARICFIS